MMSRVTSESDTLAEAVATAIAELAGVSADNVRVDVRGVALDGLSGPFHVELSASSVEVAPKPAVPDESRDGDAAESSENDTATAVNESTETTLSAEDLDEEADAAADFLEGLLDAMDLPGDLKIRVLDDHAEVEIADIGNGALIGRRGQTLDALQELVRSALQRKFERRSHVQIDAEGYRARRLEKLLEKAEDAIDEVLDTGEPVRLEPMDVFERKAVHQAVAAVEGVTSRSQGREPGRRVVIEPLDD
ncbi:MAG: R3H domain-containing nucleic acid-binding protein [Nitriliruptoraceae bacterium]